MRAIKVTYRAVFQQPIGALNPMGLKIPGDFPVELYAFGERWRARSIANGNRNVYDKLVPFSTIAHAKSETERAFERQSQAWQMWGNVPGDGNSALTVERMLEPDEIYIAPEGKVYLKQAEDYTHIIHAPSIPPGARIPPAACGAQVNAKCFISTKANVEPSCKACAEVWRKEYKNK